MTDQKTSNTRLIIGLILISIGGLFLLDNFGIFDFEFPFIIGEYLFRWQTILIVIGIIISSVSENKSTGLVFITIGVIGFLPELWPLILVGIGLYILYRKKESGDRTDKSHSEEVIDDVAIFGGGKKILQTKSFKGGSTTSIFGGSEIDLLDCQLAHGDQVIDVVAIFGGSTFIVPREWNVTIDIVPIFGGFSDNRRKDPNLVSPGDRKLVIKGIVIFGGGEVKN